jgi:hypothetical protein
MGTILRFDPMTARFLLDFKPQLTNLLTNTKSVYLSIVYTLIINYQIDIITLMEQNTS